MMRTEPVNAIAIDVEKGSILDELTSAFDCYTRSDTSDEIILDVTFLENAEDDDVAKMLFDTLGISPDSDLADEIRGNGYIIFYA